MAKSKAEKLPDLAGELAGVEKFEFRRKKFEVKKIFEGVFTSGSRPGTPEREERISTAHSSGNDLLIAVIILGIIVVSLIVIIIYGYCKYVRGGKTAEKMESTDVRQATGDIEQQAPPELVPETPQLTTVPVKLRKRSMTFSETDEECRKYREDLADSYEKALETANSSSSSDGDRSRKKSVKFSNEDVSPIPHRPPENYILFN